MPFDLLLPPLLGGYLFLTRFNGTAYKSWSYSGYRLIFGSSVFALIFLLTAAAITRVFDYSYDSVLMHHLLVPSALIGLLLVIFGSWKVIRGNRESSKPIETDEEGDLEDRERSRKISLGMGWFMSFFAGVCSLQLVRHALWGMEGIAPLNFVVSVVLAAFLTVFVVNRIKALSELRGYQVAFRLGSIIVAATALLTLGLIYQESIEYEWGKVVPFDYSGVSFIAFLLGMFWWPANLLYPYEAAVQRLADYGVVDGMQDLFYYATNTFQQVALTLIDNKVYVGYVDGEIPIAGRTDDYVFIVPTASGYRDETTKKLTLDTFYLGPFEDAIRARSDLSSDEIAKTIPLREIRSAGIFDQTIYKAFQEGKAKPKRNGSTQTTEIKPTFDPSH